MRGNLEKKYLLGLIKKLSSIYLVKLLVLCTIMGCHHNLLMTMRPGVKYNDEEILHRFQLFYDNYSTKDPPLSKPLPFWQNGVTFPKTEDGGKLYLTANEDFLAEAIQALHRG